MSMFKDSLAKFFKVDSLLSNLTGYIETRVELVKIEVKEELAKSAAKAVLYLSVAFVFALFLTFISIAIALLLSERWGNFAGFSFIAGVYLIAGLVLYLLRQKLFLKLEKRFTSMFRKKN
jgi:uncharacterized membrane protein YqjE